MGRRLVILISVIVSAGVGRALAGGGAHTSSAPQPLPFKPYNLYSLLNHDDLVAEIERRHRADKDWPAHLEHVTRGLVAAPYLLSALGEAEGVDRDPRFRLDAFDCTTFVETALALAHCDDFDQLQGLLDTIRYDGRPSFQSRRHLITSQWIPALTAAGLVRDITKEIGQEETRFIHLELSRRRWRRRRVARTLPLEADRVPFGRYHLPYLPIELARARLAQIPPGTIVNVIRADNRRSPDVVTHQGLLVCRPGGRHLLVRHASPVSKRVIDESLDHMLRRYLKPRKWPIIGINLLAVLPPEASPKRASHATSARDPG